MSLMLDDELALINDSRYKSFIVSIERVLKQFEYSTEWADLITYLVRIKKVRSASKTLAINKFTVKKKTVLISFFKDYRRLFTISIHTKTYNSIKTSGSMSSSSITIRCTSKNS